MNRPFLFVHLQKTLLLTAVLAGVHQAQAQRESGSPPDLRESPEAQAALQANALPADWFGAGPLHKIWIEEDEAAATLARLEASGGLVRTWDYGAFALAIVDERAYASREDLRATGFHFRDEQDLVVLNEIVLDGRDPERTLARLAPELRYSIAGSTALDPNAGLYLVQFEGPVRDDWLASLDEAGVTFKQYVPMNAYVVQVPPERVADLDALRRRDFVQYAGLYEPAFRIHPGLREALRVFEPEPQRVTLQLVDGAELEATLKEVRLSAEEVLDERRVGPYWNVRARLHATFFQTLASSRGVFQIEPLGEIVRQSYDERQGQIVANNVNTTGPSAPGYLAWLASQGFDSSQFGGFAVNVADDATSLTGHPDLPSGRVAFSLNPTGQTGSQGGHGFLNSNIVAGFNNGTGTTVEDTGGYNYGLGIAPFARVGSTAIFGAGALDPTSYENQAYGLSARISSNSWSFQTQFGGPVPDYDAWSQEYDFIARDASTSSGNQGYLVVFSASNNGSGSNTVSTPATAKNILTVAAGENNRQTGTDGCGISNTGANNWQDIISFSSRGPVNSAGGDGRWKPEISAPGTHIQAGIPQSNYNGSSVCNAFWPSGSTLYGWSSGTSHSCPAVAGGAALVYQDFLNNALPAPSPAMMKAVLVGSAEYMTGVGANDTLPSNSQGSGNMNLARAFDSAARILVDQTTVLGATGTSHVVAGNVADTGQPFRVALVWTDAPGPTSGAPYVNNLDLSVAVGGNTYRGNVFSGRNSITGGTADIRNNTELVFLPAGTSGAFTVTVTGTSIGGDGVPGNGDTTDQDFALVVYNGTSGAPAAPVANFTGSPTSGVAPLNVSFSDASTGSITSWAWTFGDAGTSGAQNPSHSYAAAGTYSVSLTVTGPGGSDALTRTNYITVSSTPPPPVANFSGSPTSGTAPLNVNFSDASTGSITSWAWTFGDGGTSGAQNPSHSYTSTGTYNVSLTVTGPGGAGNNTKNGYITVSAPPSGTVYYLSFTTNTTVPGVGTVADEDIVRYDSGTGTWSLYFDGSDVGIGGTDVNAFHVRANGSVLMTFDSSTVTVSGLTGGPSGTTVEDSDIILFTPTSTGATTAGSFSFYLDGSDVGLTTSSEDIDGLFEFPDGSLGISTLGNPGLSGLSSLADEDVVRFTGSFGATSSGSWSYYFDGSDVGYAVSSSGDLNAIGLSGADLVLSTVGNFTAGATWNDEDAVRFSGTFGSATSGSSSVELDLSAAGISDTENVDGLTIGN